MIKTTNVQPDGDLVNRLSECGLEHEKELSGHIRIVNRNESRVEFAKIIVDFWKGFDKVGLDYCQ